MKVTIIQFSPSGNTRKVSESIRAALEQDGTATVQMIDITRDKNFFSKARAPHRLAELVSPHDVLMIGGPVFAHHLQYHVQDLIRMLPPPDGDRWGRLAIPFVTYGGISSGIALAEAGELLKRTDRIVIGGLKVAASHRMTRAFMDQEFNAGKPNGELQPVVLELKGRLRQLAASGSVPEVQRPLRYQPWLETLAIRILFNEKKWHRERYPKVQIDANLCTGCGACARTCPVLHLEKKEGGAIGETGASECIHCFNCVVGCPRKAITLLGDRERARAFMKKAIAEHAGKEVPASRLY